MEICVHLLQFFFSPILSTPWMFHLPAYITNGLLTDTSDYPLARVVFSLLSVSDIFGCYICPLLMLCLSDISVDFQCSIYISQNCHLQVLENTLVVCLCYFPFCVAGRDDFRFWRESDCVFFLWFLFSFVMFDELACQSMQKLQWYTGCIWVAVFWRSICATRDMLTPNKYTVRVRVNWIQCSWLLCSSS